MAHEQGLLEWGRTQCSCPSTCAPPTEAGPPARQCLEQSLVRQREAEREARKERDKPSCPGSQHERHPSSVGEWHPVSCSPREKSLPQATERWLASEPGLSERASTYVPGARVRDDRHRARLFRCHQRGPHGQYGHRYAYCRRHPTAPLRQEEDARRPDHTLRKKHGLRRAGPLVPRWPPSAGEDGRMPRMPHVPSVAFGKSSKCTGLFDLGGFK